MSTGVARKLPEEVVLAVGKAVYSYSGELLHPSEDELLKLTDALAPYYPLTDDEEAAALTLREWNTARQLNSDIAAPLKRLETLAQSGVREWREVVERWFRESEYHPERRYQEERHPEMFHKELYYELRSGDPRAIIMAIERIVNESLRRNVPLTVGGPPQVQVPAELTAAVKEMAEAMQNQLGKYVEPVARAKQTLARYVHRIVAEENITREKR